MNENIETIEPSSSKSRKASKTGSKSSLLSVSSNSTLCSQQSATKIKLEETDIDNDTSYDCVSTKPTTSGFKKQKKLLRKIEPRPQTLQQQQQQQHSKSTSDVGLSRSLSFENMRVTRQMKRLSMINESSTQFKAPFSVIPWGSLYFYEGKDFKFKRDLYDNNPIRISYEIIDDTNNNNFDDEIQNINKKQFTNYTDWHYVLGDGFTLRKTAEDKSVVHMKRLDEKNKYKVFLSNKMIDIDSNEKYEIYNGNEYLNDLENIKDTSDSYEMTKYCYLTIAIIGRFMNAMGPVYLNSLNENLTREKCNNLPYWILLKLNPEYLMIDNHVQKLVFESTKKSMNIQELDEDSQFNIDDESKLIVNLEEDQ